MIRAKIAEIGARYAPLLTATTVGLSMSLWVALVGYSEIEGTSVNTRFRIRNGLNPWDKPPEDIVYITINDAALEANQMQELMVPQRWPWPRWQWGVLHDWFHEHEIKPAAIIYDIVFDLADVSPVKPPSSYRVGGIDPEFAPFGDLYFQERIENASEIPTLFAALFSPQGKTRYEIKDYKAQIGSETEKEGRTWKPPPESFARFGTIYEPAIHDPVFHAREISIPWDSKWWYSTLTDPSADHDELEFQGYSASLLEPADGAGTTILDPESDGIARWAPLLIEYNGILYPSLPLQVVLHQVGTTAADIRFGDNEVIIPRKEGGEIRVPVDDWKRMLLNFRYPWAPDEEGAFFRQEELGYEHVNYWQLVDGFRMLQEQDAGTSTEDIREVFDPRSLEGKILIIGSEATATHDLRAIPIAERYPMMGTIGTIIRGIVQEDFIHVAPGWLDSLWIIGGTFMVGLIGQFWPPLRHAFATAILASGHAVSSYLVFAYMGTIVNFFHVAVAYVVSYAVVTIGKYFQVSSIFGRYVSPEVRRFLLSNKQALQLGGQETELSILFSDLKGFTNMSEKMDATGVVTILNEYFAPMFEIIIEDNRGTLDKLIGDAIMAYFGHPQPSPDHPIQAVSAALSMQRKLVELRERWKEEGRPGIQMRIGVNTGVVVAGNMGGAGRTEYSIIGDNVNLAARLESSAPVDGVLISENTYVHVKDHFIFKERDPIQVKGKEKPVKVYEVLDFKTS